MTSGMGLLSPGSPSFTVVEILGNVKILWRRLCLGSDAKGFCDELDLILDVTLLCILTCSFLTHPSTEVRGILREWGLPRRFSVMSDRLPFWVEGVLVLFPESQRFPGTVLVY